MLGFIFQGSTDIRQRLLQRLPRQGIHQIKIDIVEMGTRQLHRLMRLAIVVDSPQRLEVVPVETLDSQ